MGKIGIKSALIIGICASLFIVAAKVVFNKFPVAGVTNVVNSI
jgi:hypothetical protein